MIPSQPPPPHPSPLSARFLVSRWWYGILSTMCVKWAHHPVFFVCKVHTSRFNAPQYSNGHRETEGTRQVLCICCDDASELELVGELARAQREVGRQIRREAGDSLDEGQQLRIHSLLVGLAGRRDLGLLPTVSEECVYKGARKKKKNNSPETSPHMHSTQTIQPARQSPSRPSSGTPAWSSSRQGA
jgi:hypothetical protein